MKKMKNMKKTDNKAKDQTLAIITHAIGIFAAFVGALLILILTRDTTIKKHAKAALNWQISFGIYSGLIFVLSVIAPLLSRMDPNIVIVFPFSLVFAALTILNIIFCVIAAIKASDGLIWKYPLSIDFMRMVGDTNIEEGKKELRKAYKEVKKDLHPAKKKR